MNRHLRRLISFFMVCVMMINGTFISANAETRQVVNGYSSSEVIINDSTIDTYLTNISQSRWMFYAL